MSVTKRALSLCLAAVFVAGIGVGTVATRGFIQYSNWKNFARGPDAVRERAMRMIARELSLSEEQLERVKPLALKFQRQLVGLRLRAQPELASHIEITLEELRPILNDEQWQKIKIRLNELDARWKRDAEWLRSAK